MKSIKLTDQERKIEMDLLDGKYQAISDDEFQEIADAINKRKKDAVLNIRVNKQDLENIKKKAEKLGVRYQTFLAEIIHKIAL